jgi:nitroreductase
MRPVFGLDYIQDTFTAYSRIVGDSARCAAFGPDELKWTHDVLSRYFEVTGSHPLIDSLRQQFRKLPAPSIRDDARFIPYRRQVEQPSPVGYEQLLALAIRRRSVRWFLPKPVPRDLVDRALAVATQSPSACNRQSFVFRVFDEPRLVRQVSDLPAGTAGFAHNFPMIVVVVGRLRSYNKERDRHVIYVDGALASMSFILALETLGLSSCCINWPDIESRERDMQQALQLENDERPIMLIAVGFPDPEGLVAYSQKKPPRQIGRYNFE